MEHILNMFSLSEHV